MTTSLRILKVNQRKEEVKIKTKEEELELFVKCHSPNFRPPELDVEHTETLGKIVIHTIKELFYRDIKTQSFVNRRFKSKKSNRFKGKLFGESRKYKKENESFYRTMENFGKNKEPLVMEK